MSTFVNVLGIESLQDGNPTMGVPKGYMATGVLNIFAVHFSSLVYFFKFHEFLSLYFNFTEGQTANFLSWIMKVLSLNTSHPMQI